MLCKTLRACASRQQVDLTPALADDVITNQDNTFADHRDYSNPQLGIPEFESQFFSKKRKRTLSLDAKKSKQTLRSFHAQKHRIANQLFCAALQNTRASVMQNKIGGVFRKNHAKKPNRNKNSPSQHDTAQVMRTGVTQNEIGGNCYEDQKQLMGTTQDV